MESEKDWKTQKVVGLVNRKEGKNLLSRHRTLAILDGPGWMGFNTPLQQDGRFERSGNKRPPFGKCRLIKTIEPGWLSP